VSAAAENVIGGILVSGEEAYWRVADLLRPEDFPTPYLASLYRVCGEVAKSPAVLDVFSVGAAAEQQGLCEAASVIGLASQTWNLSNLRGHAEQVKSDAMRRRVKAICGEGAKTGDVATVQAQLTSLMNAQPAHAVKADAAIKRMWQSVIARYESGDDLTGLRTGIPLLDEWTGGLQPQRVYGVGARAKMGKTILTMNIASNIVSPPVDSRGAPLWPAKHVGVWSLEMGEEELMQRMSCAIAGVPSNAVQRPKLLDAIEGAWERMSMATKALQAAPLYISDRLDVTIEEIEAQARQMHASGLLDLLVVDHIGLLRLPKMDRHDLAVGHVTRRLKVIAKELRIPVIAVFQLNRGSENGAAVRAPRPSDARDSGNIEQDLDSMLLLHRPSYYDKSAASGLRLDLALQRNGPTGLIRMNEELHCCRFTGGASEWTDSNASTRGRDDDL
jgi:replicative DNA helicase